LLHQGVVPNTQLSWSIGSAHRWNPDQLCWQPVTDPWGRLGESPIYVAGDSRAIVGAQVGWLPLLSGYGSASCRIWRNARRRFSASSSATHISGHFWTPFTDLGTRTGYPNPIASWSVDARR
jgi:hypothetical protein